MALDGSYLDRDELATRVGPGQAALVRGDWIDPTDEFTDPTLSARLTEWQSFVDAELLTGSATINDRLRKRYNVPFASPTPAIVLRWLVALVLPKLFEGRGWDPSDERAQSILAREQLVNDQLKEAADSNEGLFDLPLRQDQQVSAISQGGPLGYAEASPYEWLDVQREAVRG